MSNNFINRVEEEFLEVDTPGSCGSTSASPRPMKGLRNQGPPPFLSKIYEIVDDPGNNHVISWSNTGDSFVVWDLYSFTMNLLPKYFKHNNFSSFVRQLNTYGFRKVDPDKWEFANEGFLRGNKHLLKSIKRRKPSSYPSPQQKPVSPCVELGLYGAEGEIQCLQRDKNILMAELVKLRQEQQASQVQLRAVEGRLQRTEQNQQQMMAFIARAMENPEIIMQFVEQKAKRKKIEEAIFKKRISIDQGSDGMPAEPSGPYMINPAIENGFVGLESETQDSNKNVKADEAVLHQQEDECNEELDEEFWKDLFNDGFIEKEEKPEIENRVIEDVNMSVENLGFLDDLAQHEK